jgi:hypothetical protein
MESLGLPLGAYKLTWAMVAVWLVRCYSSVAPARLARHPGVSSGFLSIANLRGQTHNQAIKRSLLGYLRMPTRWHGLWWPFGWLDANCWVPQCTRRLGTLEWVADSYLWPT